MEREIHSDRARLMLQTDEGYEIWRLVTPGIEAILYTVDHFFHDIDAEDLQDADYLICPFFRAPQDREWVVEEVVRELAINVMRCPRDQTNCGEMVEFILDDNKDGTFSLMPSNPRHAVLWLSMEHPYDDLTLAEEEVDMLVEYAHELQKVGLCPN